MKKIKCFDVHTKCKVACTKKECRQWIDWEDDLNCAIICANKNGPLTLFETADRLGVSFVRVKQNQDCALKKLAKCLKREFGNIFKP